MGSVANRAGRGKPSEAWLFALLGKDGILHAHVYGNRADAEQNYCRARMLGGDFFWIGLSMKSHRNVHTDCAATVARLSCKGATEYRIIDHRNFVSIGGGA